MSHEEEAMMPETVYKKHVHQENRLNASEPDLQETKK